MNCIKSAWLPLAKHKSFHEFSENLKEHRSRACLHSSPVSPYHHLLFNLSRTAEHVRLSKHYIRDFIVLSHNKRIYQDGSVSHSEKGGPSTYIKLRVRPVLRHYGQRLHGLIHPEVSLQAFTCPILLECCFYCVRITILVSIFRRTYWAGIAMLQPK